jgi:hypothetical protein
MQALNSCPVSKIFLNHFHLTHPLFMNKSKIDANLEPIGEKKKNAFGFYKKCPLQNK